MEERYRKNNIEFWIGSEEGRGILRYVRSCDKDSERVTEILNKNIKYVTRLGKRKSQWPM